VIVEDVQKNSPAYQAQLKRGDKIVKVKYQKNEFIIKSSSDLINLSKKFAGEKIILQIERDNKVFYKEITPRKNPPPGQGALGIVITSFIEKKYPWYLAPFLGLYEAYRITATIVVELSKTIFQLLTFQKPKVDVAGPVGIAAYTATVVKFGKNAVLELMALLSLNLAVVNLLPFPALDGGRLVFVLYEWFTKKRPKEEIERYTNLIGLIFLLALSAIITYRDIIKLINK
jgi:regulator of sigma E protease